jgi:hypothetical protein
MLHRVRPRSQSPDAPSAPPREVYYRWQHKTMSADPAHTEEQTEDQDEHLQELMRCVRALDTYAPAEIAKLLASPGLTDYARRAVEAVAALQMVNTPQLATELAPLLAFGHSGAGAHCPDVVADRIMACAIQNHRRTSES